MATLIPCEVDTTPMADELRSVSKHVMGTTAAVVAMESAVIAAENASADKVCKNVNRGFFALLQSQISQKIANKQSRVEALLMKLAQQKRQLLGIKANMEREYGRITERYLRIFTVINKGLEQRIRQLDQPVFEFVNKHMVTASNRMHALIGCVSTSQTEGLYQSQQILVSRIKYNAKSALEQSANFLLQIGEQRVLTDKVLISNLKGNEDKAYQIPVIVWETIDNSVGIPQMKVVANGQIVGSNLASIGDFIRNETDLPWRQEGSSAEITEEFSHILETSSSSPRVKNVIKEMYSSANIETL